MKRIIAMLLAVMMVFALCACGNGDKDKDSDVKDDGKVDLTFATGGEQGTYYAFGTVLAQQVSDKTSARAPRQTLRTFRQTAHSSALCSRTL